MSEVSWAIYQGVSYFINIVSGLIFVYCVLSWITRPDSSIFRFVSRLVQPLLEPFRPLGNKLIEKGFRVDLTPWLAMIALQILQRVLLWIFWRL